MKNNPALLIYGLTVFVVVFLAYNRYDKTRNIQTDKAIVPLDSHTIDMYRTQYDINQSFGYLWGVGEPKRKTSVKPKRRKVPKRRVKQKHNTLCIAESCYHFLGIFYRGGVPYISFESKRFKKGFQDFTLHQTLDSTLYIKSIQNDRIILAERNTSNEWVFHLFDVNVTQYKPKRIQPKGNL